MKAVALLALAVLASASAAQKATPRKLVEQQIAKYCSALGKKDIRGIQAVITPDFKAYNQRGQSAEAKDVIRQLSSLFKQAKKVKLSCVITSFKMEKGNVRLTSRNVMDLDLPSPGGINKLHDESTSDEVWVPMNGTFRVKSSRTLTSKVSVNGKAMPPG